MRTGLFSGWVLSLLALATLMAAGACGKNDRPGVRSELGARRVAPSNRQLPGVPTRPDAKLERFADLPKCSGDFLHAYFETIWGVTNSLRAGNPNLAASKDRCHDFLKAYDKDFQCLVRKSPYSVSTIKEQCAKLDAL